MRQNPCSECRHFRQFDTGAISCWAVRDPQFYWPETQDEMMNHCPLGWRAVKASGKSFDFFRETKNIHKLA